MRFFVAATLVAFGCISCKRTQQTPPAPESPTRTSPKAPGLECALWRHMPEEERRRGALSAIEGSLKHVRGPLPPEVAWCQLGRLDAFVVAYARACSQTKPTDSPVNAAFDEVLADCRQLPRDAEVHPRPPLRHESAPELICPAGATAKALEAKTAEFCSRPGEVLDGPAREWFANGSQRSADLWANGKKVGTWLSWGEDGASISAESYRDGQLDGPEVFWFPNGRRRTLTYYRGNQRNGVTAEWSNDGQQIVLGGFENGQKHGLWYLRKPGTGDAMRTNFEHGHDEPAEVATFPAR
jgi:hypothetical protein